MTAVLDSLGSDMHTNHITSSSFSTVHKSQDSPTLPVSTVTDSSFYSSSQTGHCTGTAYAQLASYSYHPGTVGNVHYSPKAYDLGYASSYGAYGTYGPSSSPTPTEPGKTTSAFPNVVFFYLHFLLIFYNYIFVVNFDREGREWTGGAHGEWKAKESPETANHLLQFSAGGSPAQIPKDPVSRAPRTRRTGGVFGPHTDPGQNADSFVHDVAMICVDCPSVVLLFSSRPVSKIVLLFFFTIIFRIVLHV